jgi:hypothetical protein
MQQHYIIAEIGKYKEMNMDTFAEERRREKYLLGKDIV